jgi:hypothetical protein
MALAHLLGSTPHISRLLRKARGLGYAEAAQLLGAPGMSAAKVARLARMERCVPIIHYIAEAGARENPDDPSFWLSLLEQLPACPPIPEGRMPHPSRFMSQPGWSPPSRPVRRASWLRAHG